MSIGLGIGNSVSGKVSGFGGGGGGIDPNAQAYITAAGITDPTEQAAVNQLVLDLKGTGSTTNNTDVWSDSYTIYPLSPTSLTAAEYNLKDPTQNITWLNNPTHAYTGITGNGINAYGDTNWNPTTEGVDINNAGLTYSGEYSDVDYALGVYNSVRWFVIRNSANRKISYIGASSAAANPIDFNRSISTAVRTSGTLIKMYTNGTQSSSNSASSGGSVVPNANFFLLGYSNSGVLSAPFAGEMDFAAIHKGLTANQAKDLSDAITTYNTAVRIDPDATAYITAAGITDPTEQAAVFQLVSDLKGTGSTTNNTDVWSDSYTIYPLSPTSLTAAEYNLKDPTQNITWLNNPTHATTGITGNGINAYGDTNWNPTTEGVDLYNSGLTYSGEYSDGDYVMGALSSGRFMAFRNITSLRVAYIGSGTSSASFANTTRLITTSSRTDKFLNQVYNNGVFQSQNTTSGGSTNATPDANVFILGYSNSGVLSGAAFAGEIDFVAAHKGLSANQVQDLSDAITTYNTAVR